MSHWEGSKPLETFDFTSEFPPFFVKILTVICQ